jgi:hypothetical protein
MASRTEEIIDALVAQLRLPEDLDPIHEGLEDLVVDEFPLRAPKGIRIRVYPFDEKVAPFSQQLVRRELLVKLELFVGPVPDGLPPNKALDPLYVWCIQRLMADRDRGTAGQLGGRVDSIQERGRGWAGDEKEAAWARTVIDIAVIYRTLANDPERRA